VSAVACASSTTVLTLLCLRLLLSYALPICLIVTDTLMSTSALEAMKLVFQLLMLLSVCHNWHRKKMLNKGCTSRGVTPKTESWI